MEIVLHQEFLSNTKNKWLLLDTCVFIDAFSHAKEFGIFFNKLKENDTTLVTTTLVLNEFLKGSQTEEKFLQKKEYVLRIIDTLLPSNDVQNNIEILHLQNPAQ